MTNPVKQSIFRIAASSGWRDADGGRKTLRWPPPMAAGGRRDSVDAVVGAADAEPADAEACGGGLHAEQSRRSGRPLDHATRAPEHCNDMLTFDGFERPGGFR